jgi:hypothetical protein
VLPELDDGTVVPLSELQRLACDCELTRIVLDADGVPLDVGRTQRTYTKELRRAVLARDGHCRWPGCTLRAEWCEVHHVRWYSHGGVTSLANALTLCTFHHHEVHRHDIAITTTAAGTRFTRSHGTPIGTSMPTGARRLLRPSAAVAAPTEVPVDVLPEAGGHRETAPEVPDAALDTVPRADRRSSRPGLAGTAAWAWERAADQPRLIDELPVSEPP